MALAGCDLPRDPNDTFTRVQGGELRAGITGNPPWTSYQAGRAGGSEARLIEAFAQRLQARVTWSPVSEAELVARLDDGRLDIAVGGFTDDTPWRRQAGVSRAYLQTARGGRVMLVPQGENRWLLELDRFLAHQAKAPPGSGGPSGEPFGEPSGEPSGRAR